MKGPYGFDIAPRFWEIIDELTNAGRLACPTLVYDELRDAPDVLKEWAAARRLSGLFVDPSEDVQLDMERSLTTLLLDTPRIRRLVDSWAVQIRG